MLVDCDERGGEMRVFPLLWLCACTPSKGDTGTRDWAEVVPGDIEGYWTGDWGDMVVEVTDDNVVRAAYSHDSGTVTGELGTDSVVRGWWCESPTREADDDAGQVEFYYYKPGEQFSLDGRWTYGTSGEWHDDWDLSFSGGDPPEELVERLASEPEAFCEGP